MLINAQIVPYLASESLFKLAAESFWYDMCSYW